MGFVAVHLGAGCHSRGKLPTYKDICYEACRVGMHLCKSGHSASYIACKVVEILENSEQTNAGIGSNLTTDGIIQCDAGLMDSFSSNFAAVGGIEGIKNPIKVAYELLMNQEKSNHSLVPPMILIGDGARHFATANRIEQIHNKEMITENSLKCFKKALEKVKEKKHDERSYESIHAAHKNDMNDQSDMLNEKKNQENQKHNAISSDLSLPCASKTSFSQIDAASISNSLSLLKGKKQRKHKHVVEKDSVNSKDSAKSKAVKRSKLSLLDDFGLSVNKNDTLDSSSETLKNLSSINNLGSSASEDTDKLANEKLEHERRLKNSINYTDYHSVMTEKLDTVGAICVDSYGNVCSAVSSGGLLLKHPGRIGPAACYACGCFVGEKVNNSEHIIASCSASGCGEQLIKTLLAKHCVDSLLSDSENTIMNPSSLLQDGFLNSSLLRNECSKMAGCINIKLARNFHSEGEIPTKCHMEPFQDLVEESSKSWQTKRHFDEHKNTEFCYNMDLLIACTTKSFCAGFMTTRDKNPRFLMLEMPESQQIGNTVISQGFHFQW